MVSFFLSLCIGVAAFIWRASSLSHTTSFIEDESFYLIDWGSLFLIGVKDSECWIISILLFLLFFWIFKISFPIVFQSAYPESKAFGSAVPLLEKLASEKRKNVD